MIILNNVIGEKKIIPINLGSFSPDESETTTVIFDLENLSEETINLINNNNEFELNVSVSEFTPLKYFLRKISITDGKIYFTAYFNMTISGQTYTGSSMAMYDIEDNYLRIYFVS